MAVLHTSSAGAGPRNAPAITTSMTTATASTENFHTFLFSIRSVMPAATATVSTDQPDGPIHCTDPIAPGSDAAGYPMSPHGNPPNGKWPRKNSSTIQPPIVI